MKRRDLIKRLEADGYKIHRHGAEHDIYTKNRTAVQVPRHSEINEITANKILKDAGLK